MWTKKIKIVGFGLIKPFGLYLLLLDYTKQITKGEKMKTETIKKVLNLKRQDLNLIQYALDLGHFVQIDYNDGSELEKSKDFEKLKEDANAICDEYHIHIYNNEGKKLGWAFVVYGNEDHELVSDHTYNRFMENWSTSYEKQFGAYL